MANNRYLGQYPVIGIRHTIDGRRGPLKVREGLEEQTMAMANAAKKLFEENICYSNGEPVKVVIADTTIGRVAESAACADKFKKDGEVSITVSASDLKPEGKTSSTVIYDKSANSGYNVADIFLNINHSGHLKLESGNTYQLYPLRNWQIIDSLTNNYFVQPDFHYTVIDESGKLCKDIISIDNNGIITALSKGTAIVLVTYDALIYPSSIGDDHFFGAI